MGNIIAKCTDFNLSSRQSAREIESKLKALREENSLIASLEFTPLNDSNQKALLRPIGFNAIYFFWRNFEEKYCFSTKIGVYQ
ncbi:unnamed protein product, partial [Mesorhabditis belari]|uniref:Uncharacterized protein n=1 Tax=Mesorhabditis belari TaxID=2138241 RepID=A0AAF3FRF8_9BILA